MSTLGVNIGCQHWVSTLGVNIRCQHWVSTFGCQHWGSPLCVNIGCHHWVSTLGVNIGGHHLGVNIGCQHWVSTLCVNIGCEHCVSTLGVHIWVSTLGVNIWVSTLGVNIACQHWITQDKAPNQFNNTPLANQQCRVLLVPKALTIVTMADKGMLTAPQTLVDTLQRPRRAFGTAHQTQTHTGIHTCDTACKSTPSQQNITQIAPLIAGRLPRLPPLICPPAYHSTKGGGGGGWW